jgi:hypothetical protein
LTGVWRQQKVAHRRLEECQSWARDAPASSFFRTCEADERLLHDW